MVSKGGKKRVTKKKAAEEEAQGDGGDEETASEYKQLSPSSGGSQDEADGASRSTAEGGSIAEQEAEGEEDDAASNEQIVVPEVTQVLHHKGASHDGRRCSREGASEEEPSVGSRRCSREQRASVEDPSCEARAASDTKPATLDSRGSTPVQASLDRVVEEMRDVRAKVDVSLQGFAGELQWTMQQWLERQDEVAERLSAVLLAQHPHRSQSQLAAAAGLRPTRPAAAPAVGRDGSFGTSDDIVARQSSAEEPSLMVGVGSGDWWPAGRAAAAAAEAAEKSSSGLLPQGYIEAASAEARAAKEEYSHAVGIVAQRQRHQKAAAADIFQQGWLVSAAAAREQPEPAAAGAAYGFGPLVSGEQEEPIEDAAEEAAMGDDGAGAASEDFAWLLGGPGGQVQDGRESPLDQSVGSTLEIRRKLTFSAGSQKGRGGGLTMLDVSRLSSSPDPAARMIVGGPAQPNCKEPEPPAPPHMLQFGLCMDNDDYNEDDSLEVLEPATDVRSSGVRRFPPPRQEAFGGAMEPGPVAQLQRPSLPRPRPEPLEDFDSSSMGAPSSDGAASVAKAQPAAASSKAAKAEDATAPLRQGQQKKRYRRLEKVVQSWPYEIANGLLLVLGVVLAAFASQRESQLLKDDGVDDGEATTTLLAALEFGLVTLYASDLFLRLTGTGCVALFSQPLERWWTVFDCFLVPVAFLQVALRLGEALASEPTSVLSSSSRHGVFLLSRLYVLRSVRLCRITIARSSLWVLRLSHEMRLLAGAAKNAALSCLWLAVGTAALLMLASMLLTDAVLAYDAAHPASKNMEELQAHFGDFGSTFQTLHRAFEDASGNFRHHIGSLLEPFGLGYKFVFQASVLLATVACNGLLTAVLVEAFLRTSRSCREVDARNVRNEKLDFVESLEANLQRLDNSGCGVLRLSDFEDGVQDPDLRAYFNAMELNVDHMRTLFSLLDHNRSGLVDIEKLVSGCLYLEGKARAVDVVMLQYELSMVRNMVQTIGDTLMDQLEDPNSGQLRGAAQPHRAALMRT
eukprot:TRINITY_DN35714_c0_g1_i1.p1 TRINITY_DN35714_c0_g1~~TRINITY_DN35714_c0_g1_i1.p1  ORF type:complete len:1022 (+),score=294.71 TRINITY_DN35714_c0_g1_i1:135-3200(+)